MIFLFIGPLRKKLRAPTQILARILKSRKWRSVRQKIDFPRISVIFCVIQHARWRDQDVRFWGIYGLQGRYPAVLAAEGIFRPFSSFAVGDLHGAF